MKDNTVTPQDELEQSLDIAVAGRRATVMAHCSLHSAYAGSRPPHETADGRRPSTGDKPRTGKPPAACTGQAPASMVQGHRPR